MTKVDRLTQRRIQKFSRGGRGRKFLMQLNLVKCPEVTGIDFIPTRLFRRQFSWSCNHI